jgi:glycosyltransferase involved in cell wall biosynthesis
MKILMIGPGEGVVGGIVSLIETVLPVLKLKSDIKYFPTVSNRSPKDSGIFSFLNIRIAFSQYLRFIWVLFSFRPQIIHIHTSQGLAWLKDTYYAVVSKTCRRKIVLHMHGGNFSEHFDRFPAPIRWFSRTVLFHADAIIAVSDDWKKRMADLLPLEKTLVIRNCIAINKFNPNPYRIPNHRINAIFLGAIGKSKGIYDLIAALDNLPSNYLNFIHIKLAGNEECEGDIAQILAQIRDRDLEDVCQFYGLVIGDDKQKLLEESDLFILPSYHEALPIAVLEAMGAGLAILATPVGGIPEVVQDGWNGFLIPPGDTRALAERLMMLISDIPLLRLMGQHSRGFAEQELDVEPFVNKLVNLYSTLI